MKKMMKRALSVVMTLALCLTLLPTTAFAWGHKCSVCGKDQVPATCGGWYCVENGYAVHIVKGTNCVDEENGGDGTIDAHDHQCDRCHAWMDESIDSEITKQPTCTETGTKVYHCSHANCNKNNSEETIPALGHDLTEIPGTAADCLTAGSTSYWHCSRCGKNYSDKSATTEVLGSDPIGALGHDYTSKDSEVKADGANGHYWTCARHPDDASHNSANEAHTFGKWGKNDATTHKATCSVCGYEKTEDHKFGAWSDNGDGKHIHTCSECGFSATAGHTFDKPNAIVWTVNTTTDADGWYVTADPTKLARDGVKHCDDCTYTEPVHEEKDRGYAKLTINYVYVNGNVASDPHQEDIRVGLGYNVESPVIPGYTADKLTVQGTVATSADITVTVTYTPNPHNLTITTQYVDANGNAIEDMPDVTTAPVTVAYGTPISDPGVSLTGFSPKSSTWTSGMTMPDNDLNIVVVLQRNEYTMVINYLNGRGETIANQYVDNVMYNGKSYNVTSPVVPGYLLDAPDNDGAKKGTFMGTDLNDGNRFVINVYYHAENQKPVLVQFVDEAGNNIGGNVATGVSLDETDNTRHNVPVPAAPAGYEVVPGQAQLTAAYGDTEGTVAIVLNVTVRLANYTLTVYHEYYNEVGTLDHSVTVNGGANFTMGQSYSTSPRYEARFDLSATPANASGTFGAGNVAVTYVYNASTGGGTPPTPPVESGESNPPETPSPEVNLPEPELPLVESPELPEVELPEPELPLTEQPEVEVEIDLPQIPTSDAPDDVEIEDPELPLANVPQTGDISGMWYAAVALPVCGLGMVFSLKKREDEDEEA